MKKLLIILMFPISLCLIGCSHWHTDYAGLYKNEKFKFQNKKIKGNTNTFKWRITYANYKPVAMNAATMDWGPPYSTDVFAEKAFLIKNDTFQYKMDTSFLGKPSVAASMLYIPFKDSEDKAGNDYFELLNDQWLLFDSLFNQNRRKGMPVILGIVEGSKTATMQVFKGSIRGKKVLLKIGNDGRVVYQTDAKKSKILYSGLSNAIQMPGKILYLKLQDSALSLTEIKILENKYGTNPSHYFDIKIKE